MKTDLKKRFYEKFIVRPGTRCWIWISKRHSWGYGIISAFGTFKTAHRISWLLHYGTVPEGLCVLHRCDNPLCVNPEHLFLGTQQDNMTDRKNKGRAPTGAGHWNWQGGVSRKYAMRGAS